MQAMSANHKVIGIRWSVVEKYSDGTQYAVAWNDPQAPHESEVARVECPKEFSENQVYAELNKALCHRYKLPQGTKIENDRGDTI
jgi:hypothetical protein